MTDLEIRALMGDKKVQRECTENGIVLSCPCCKAESEICTEESAFINGPKRQFYYIRCKSCFTKSGLYTIKIAAIYTWNTRPAPPVGGCDE